MNGENTVLWACVQQPNTEHICAVLFHLCEIPTVMEVIEKESRMEGQGRGAARPREEKQKVVFDRDGVLMW